MNYEAEGILPLGNKVYKVFFVELDDEDRERVLSGLVENISVDVDREYGSIMSDYSMAPVASYMDHEEVWVKAKLKRREDGTYYTIENFSIEDEEEE